MLFISVKVINRLWKELNRLSSKGMSNIYLKATIEKKWHTQIFDFLSLNLSSFKLSSFLLHLKNQVSDSKSVCSVSIIDFERNYDVLKSKSPSFLFNKNININENKTGLKMKHPTQINLKLQAVYEWRIKSKTVRSWSWQKKKEWIFCKVFFIWRKCFYHLCFF